MENSNHPTGQSAMPLANQNLSIQFGILDEWIGVTDPKKRRIIQNRLNQRLSRERRRATTKKTGRSKPRGTWPPTAIGSTSKINFAQLDECLIFGPTSEKARQIMQTLEAMIHTEFALGSPNADMLLGVTRLNILRALNTNTDVLGYDSVKLMNDDAQSPFNMVGPMAADSEGTLLPLALRPTQIQRTVPHHPWLDLFPIPRMRDIMILAGDSYDDVRLCHDMLGDRYSRIDLEGKAGLIVWKDPWDPTGWEVTPTYMKFWGWTVEGCWDLFSSTNAWRAKRGEKALFKLPEEGGEYS
ncbi:uncharacterized protein TRUGW13939_07440 [Talaromyces rugulosus]|uniref:BZIP domain-containing protein n=1 Tax=Talaromyces rugulosus TaxID=121627 RepID=A0A7H8R238_TALRU|nr:uncharacterized protein TRUGW13939_07440 [Talaromyces rugulosus]QKX60297.1 hypothetical protein TRUGW13939_07440 [Talaromyces rugulosus]